MFDKVMGGEPFAMICVSYLLQYVLQLNIMQYHLKLKCHVNLGITAEIFMHLWVCLYLYLPISEYGCGVLLHTCICKCMFMYAVQSWILE